MRQCRLVRWLKARFVVSCMKLVCDMSGGSSVWALWARVNFIIVISPLPPAGGLCVNLGLRLGPIGWGIRYPSKSGPKSINRFLDDFSHLPHLTGLRPTVPRLGHPPEASRLLCKRPEALAAALQVLIWLLFMYSQLYFTAYVISPLIYVGSVV